MNKLINGGVNAKSDIGNHTREQIIDTTKLKKEATGAFIEENISREAPSSNWLHKLLRKIKNRKEDSIKKVLMHHPDIFYQVYRNDLLDFLMKYRRQAFWITLVGIGIVHYVLFKIMFGLLEQQRLDTIIVTTLISVSALESILIFNKMVEKVFSSELEDKSNAYMQTGKTTREASAGDGNVIEEQGQTDIYDGIGES